MKNAHHFPKKEAGAQDGADYNFSCIRSPRQKRVLDALYNASDWISREEVDRIAGASNGPQIILALRRGLVGYDGIQMERRDAVDRDGRACHPGQYRLTEPGRQRARCVLGEVEE